MEIKQWISYPDYIAEIFVNLYAIELQQFREHRVDGAESRRNHWNDVASMAWGA